MNTAAKIVLAGVVGTTFMTLYSYLISKKEKQQFTEPVLLDKLIRTAGNLPEINNDKVHPAGWLAHYGIGIVFVICYRVLWHRSLKSPGILKGLVAGAASGIVAIVAWRIMFEANRNPPHNDRYKYYRQLFVAHLIFSTSAMFGYKLPEYAARLGN